MAEKLFTQEEINRIVAGRLGRERDRLAREYENSLKRCMAAIHLMLHQEMCSMKRDLTAEAAELPGDNGAFAAQRPEGSRFQRPAGTKKQQGEVKVDD